MDKQGYSKIDTILIFSKNNKLIKTVEEIGNKLEIQVHPTITYTDIIAVPCFLIILDTDLILTLKKDEIESISEALSFENADELILIFTKPHKLISSSFNKKQVKIPEFMDKQFLEPTILNQYKRYKRADKKRKDYEKIISRRMFLLLEGMKGNFIRIKDWTREFNVSERTIYRDIEFLRGMGQLFEYDKLRNAYKLVYSEYKDVFDKIK